ncbi:hypothetical protein [Embleya sp. NPDC050493]|uniref:hypothetical protein n=1 Tax=Embleya sp. NPDC050493 TaxID=3363989 RepID=UPI0037B92F6D
MSSNQARKNQTRRLAAREGIRYQEALRRLRAERSGDAAHAFVHEVRTAQSWELLSKEAPAIASGLAAAWALDGHRVLAVTSRSDRRADACTPADTWWTRTIAVPGSGVLDVLVATLPPAGLRTTADPDSAPGSALTRTIDAALRDYDHVVRIGDDARCVPPTTHNTVIMTIPRAEIATHGWRLDIPIDELGRLDSTSRRHRLDLTPAQSSVLFRQIFANRIVMQPCVGLVTTVEDDADPDTNRDFHDAVYRDIAASGLPVLAELPHTWRARPKQRVDDRVLDLPDGPFANAYRHAAREVRAAAQLRRADRLG